MKSSNDKSEARIQSEIFGHSGKVKGLILFRNETGMFYQGKKIWLPKYGEVLIDLSTLRLGLEPGSSDLIGWQTIEVTPEMVGKEVAVFTAIEVKTKDGRVSDKQKKFLRNVRNGGGIARVFRSMEEFLDDMQIKEG